MDNLFIKSVVSHLSTDALLEIQKLIDAEINKRQGDIFKSVNHSDFNIPPAIKVHYQVIYSKEIDNKSHILSMIFGKNEFFDTTTINEKSHGKMSFCGTSIKGQPVMLTFYPNIDTV